MAKKRKPKLSPEEIMARIIDEEQLKERKESSKSSSKKIKTEEIKEENKELKWHQKPMKKEKFKVQEIDNKFFAQYDEWKENIWIGPYDTEKDVNDVINMYVKETKKKPINRIMKNIHSILFS